MIRITGLGWAKISLNGKEICEAGYFTDLPIDLLKGFYDVLSNNRNSSCVIADCEKDFENWCNWLEDCPENYAKRKKELENWLNKLKSKI